MSKRATKKAAKYQRGDAVWIKGTFVDGTDMFPQVMVRGYCFVDARQHEGGLDIITVAPSQNVTKRPKKDTNPAVKLFKWSPKKQPTPKGAKKK